MAASAPYKDDNGREHTRRCWERAEGSLMDCLLIEDIDRTVEYIEDPVTGYVADYRIPAWDATQQALVATWLSDGTVSCDCED